LGLRPDGTNPCRHVKKYTGSKRTRLITDDELARLYAYLDHADAEGLEHPLLTLAIRLQFDFAARMSEVLELQWKWIDFTHRRVVWPDSKTGGMSKPLSAEAALLLRAAPRYQGSKFVVPALFDGSKPMSKHTYWAGWRRILERAGLPHCGTHAVRHRAATDIANSGVPLKVGMALTAHKTATMFMRYVHTEDEPIREAAETVASRRRKIVQGVASAADVDLLQRPPIEPARAAAAAAPRAIKTMVDSRSASIGVGNYRPYRNRNGENRPAPPKPARRDTQVEGADHV